MAPLRRHAGAGPGFIQKRQVIEVETRLRCFPAAARLRYVGALLLGGMQRFF
jgi:hypothetical protein